MTIETIWAACDESNSIQFFTRSKDAVPFGMRAAPIDVECEGDYEPITRIYTVYKDRSAVGHYACLRDARHKNDLFEFKATGIRCCPDWYGLGSDDKWWTVHCNETGKKLAWITENEVRA